MEKFRGASPRVTRKYSPLILFILALLVIVFSVLAVRTLWMPTQTEAKTVVNTIDRTITLDYDVIVRPSFLYPSGGKVLADNSVYLDLLAYFYPKSSVTFQSAQPVQIDCTSEITYSILSENAWERFFKLDGVKPLQSGLVNEFLAADQTRINLNDVQDFVNRVEDETSTTVPYQLVVRQVVRGQVFDANGALILTLNDELQMPFDLSGQFLRYLGKPDDQVLSQTTAIEAFQPVKTVFNLFGLALPIRTAQIGFGLSALVPAILFTLFLRNNRQYNRMRADYLKNTGRSMISEKKGRGKIVPITHKIVPESLTHIPLNSFNDLLRIADEKEEPIFKYSDGATSIYYIVNSTYVYVFQNPDTATSLSSANRSLFPGTK